MQEIATYLRAVLDIFNNLMSEVVGIPDNRSGSIQ